MATSQTKTVGIPKRIKLVELALDPQNPRLAAVETGRTQPQLAICLYQQMAVDEIAWSISENGFFEEEPLLVIKTPIELRKQVKAEYIVVEGNRRLAAVKLLTDAGLRAEAKVGDDLPQLTGKRASELKELPCIEYPSKQSLWEYLGFRHINGVKSWDSLSKATYVADVHENFNVPLDEIARKIGDRHAFVTRIYRGLLVLRQAEGGEFSREDRYKGRFSFSHLYTALDSEDVQRFIGIDPTKPLKSNPVPSKQKKELAELFTWLYGSQSKGVPSVIRSQNPDLNTLKDVLATPKAISELRRSGSLSLAFNVALGDERRFQDAVFQVEEGLKQALATVATGFNRKDTSIKSTLIGLGRLWQEFSERTATKAPRS
jgi:hypothetical protein